tara:strand:- start:17 stop:211 length:195 start_codon:yes stop_codon:yes gene_type:complete
VGINRAQSGKKPISRVCLIEKEPSDDVKEYRKNLGSVKLSNGIAENLPSALHDDVAGHHPVEVV